MSDELQAPKPLVVPVDPEVEAVAAAHLRAGGGLLPAGAAGGAAGAGAGLGERQPAGNAPSNGGAVGAPAAAPALQRIPPPASREPGWYRPIFVLAPARSNSSVVSSMVGMHPELFGFPELSLFRGTVVRDLTEDRPGARGLPQRARTAGLARALAQLHDGRQDEETVARARQWLAERPDWDVAYVMDHLLGLVAPASAIEKSPEDSNREDYLERLDAAYPRARYLHVTRHPVTTVKSMYGAWFHQKLWDIPDDRFYLHLLGTWLFHHARVKAFTSRLPPDRWMRVRSEDVLNDPAVTLPRICRWLGIDAGDEAVEAMMHPERSPFARLGPSNALGGNDPKFLEAPAVRKAELPTSLDIPAEWEVDPWLYLALVQFAGSVGYTHEGG